MAFQKGQSGNPKGRPRKADSHAGAVAAAEKKIADRLPRLIENMMALAALADELGELRRERDTLQEPDFTPTMAKDYVERVWDMVTTIQKDVLPGINKRLDKMDDRHDALDSRLTMWFERRERGRMWENAYRVVLLVLVAADLLIRVRGV